MLDFGSMWEPFVGYAVRGYQERLIPKLDEMYGGENWE